MTNKIEEILTDYTGQELPQWISYPCFTPHEKSCVFLVGKIRVGLKISEKDGLIVAESLNPYPNVNLCAPLTNTKDWERVGHLIFDVLVRVGGSVRARRGKSGRAILQNRTLLAQLDEAKELIRGTWEVLG